MAHPVEIIEDKVSEARRDLDRKYKIIGKWAIIIFMAVALSLFFCYKWEYPWWEFEYPIDA